MRYFEMGRKKNTDGNSAREESLGEGKPLNPERMSRKTPGTEEEPEPPDSTRFQSVKQKPRSGRRTRSEPEPGPGTRRLVLSILTCSASPSSLVLSLGPKPRIEASSPAQRSPPAVPPPAAHVCRLLWLPSQQA